MKKNQGKIGKVVLSFSLLAAISFICFNLPGYNSWIVALSIFSLICALAGWIYTLVEVWNAGLKKFSIFKSEGITEILAVDQHYHQGKIYLLQGKTNRAIKEFNRILSLNPEDSDVYYQLGKISQEKGRNKEAVRFFERYLQLDKEKKWKEEAEEVLLNIRKGTPRKIGIS